MSETGTWSHTVPVYYIEERGELQFFATEIEMFNELREWFCDRAFEKDRLELMAMDDSAFEEWLADNAWMDDRISYGWGEMALPRGWSFSEPK